MKVQYNVFLIASAVIMTVTACDMLESSPYNVHVTGEKHLTEKNIRLIEETMAGRESFRFAMISDTQRCYDETLAAVKHINARGDIDFVLHGGDLSEYGATKEFLWQRDILNRLEMPYVCVIGNHDCIATGTETYEAVFGPLNFAFVAGRVKFLCLNTNALEFDHSTAVPDMGFIKHQLSTLEPEVTGTVVLMHAGPYSEQFDNNIAEELHSLFKRFPGLQFCLYGHGHHLNVGNPFRDGVEYYECPSIDTRIYLVFTINSDGSYDYEVVEY